MSTLNDRTDVTNKAPTSDSNRKTVRKRQDNAILYAIDLLATHADDKHNNNKRESAAARQARSKLPVRRNSNAEPQQPWCADNCVSDGQN